MPTTYYSKVIDKIDDKEWLLEEFEKAGKHKKEHPEESRTRYLQLIEKLTDLATEDDSLVQKLFGIRDLSYAHKIKLIGKSRNQTWLKAVRDKYDPDKPFDSKQRHLQHHRHFYDKAKLRLRDLERV